MAYAIALSVSQKIFDFDYFNLFFTSKLCYLYNYCIFCQFQFRVLTLTLNNGMTMLFRCLFVCSTFFHCMKIYYIRFYAISKFAKLGSLHFWALFMKFWACDPPGLVYSDCFLFPCVLLTFCILLVEKTNYIS